MIFDKETLIGANSSGSELQYIEIAFHPCKIDCFLPKSDPVFEEELKMLLTEYFMYIKFVDSYSNLMDYETPLGYSIATTLEMTLHQQLQVKKIITLEQI